MARLVQAVGRYGPRVVDGPHARAKDLADWMAVAGLNSNVARMVISELGNAMRFHLLRGSPVVLPGVGRLRVTVIQDMELRLRFAPDRALLQDVQDREQFAGRIANAQRGGLSHAEYKELWDAEFPDDPLQIPTGPPRKTRPAVVRRGKRRKLSAATEDAET